MNLEEIKECLTIAVASVLLTVVAAAIIAAIVGIPAAAIVWIIETIKA